MSGSGCTNRHNGDMAVISDMAMALRIAARNMRGGPRSLWLLAVGVFIGTAAVVLGN